MRRHEQAITEAKTAQELDPLSRASNINLAVAFNMARRHEEAIEQLQETIEMYPNDGMTYYQLGMAYWHGSMYEEAIAALQKATTLGGADNRRTRANLALFYAISGRRDEARKILHELLELEKQRYVPPLHIAYLYIGLDEKEQALPWLEKAYEVRDADMLFFPVYLLDWFPELLRDDPRFQDLLRRMNYPE
jgi:tetratricopeptide (TPR) repeat protein